MRGLLIVTALFALTGTGAAQPPQSTRRAVLVGVNDYRNPLKNLHGPLHDVSALASVLEIRFGFSPADLKRIEDRGATRDRILDALQTLMRTSLPGDIAFFYYSGHGSYVANESSPEEDKTDETIVPHPYPARSDIRDKEIGTILEQAARRGVRVTAVFDSCHSGSIARGVARSHKPKMLRPASAAPKIAAGSRPDPAGAGALVISAAQEYQIAEDANEETNGQSVFTFALLRALQEAPPDEPVLELFARTTAMLRNEGASQQPSLEAGSTRLREPLFGGPVSGGGLAVASVGLQGKLVALHGGIAVGLGPGAVLTRRSDAGPKLSVRVVAAQLAESQAQIVSGDAATVKPGQLFEVTEWTALLPAVLHVHMPPARARADILTAVRRLGPLRNSPQVEWVTDPTATVPSHVLTVGGGRSWLSFPDGRRIALSASPTASEVAGALKDELPPKRNARPRLYVRLPPPRELAAVLNDGLANHSALQREQDDTTAQYVLAGRAVWPDAQAEREPSLQYAWVLAGSVVTEQGHRMPLPVRSAWTEVTEERAAAERGARNMEIALLHILRVHDWLVMPSPPDDGLFPYHLVLREEQTGRVLGAEEFRKGATLRLGRRYDLMLRARPEQLLQKQRARRAVYVFAVNTNGSIRLLFPRKASVGATEVTFPSGSDDRSWRELVALGASVRVDCPVGVETYVVLRTQEVLQNLLEIEQDPVVRRTRTVTGIERLLRTAGVAKRSDDMAVVTGPDWSLERLQVESRTDTQPCP